MNNIPGITVKLPDGSDFVMYKPTEKQLEFHQSDASKLIAIGNRGGGKSVMLRMDAHMRALSCPGCSMVLVRKTYKDLLKNHIFFQGLPWGSLKKEMELLGGEFNKTDYICHYPNGSKLFLSYVGHESDALNLLGAELLAAYFDELSTIPWDFFTQMLSSVRVPTGSNWTPVTRAATNPLGESTHEIYKYFVNKDVDYEEDRDYNPKAWAHIKINMQDNSHIDAEGYKKDLISLNLPEHMRRAWIDGEYIEETALFSFYPTKDAKPYHVLNYLDIEDLVKKAKIYRVYDHGWSPDPAYCAWIAHLGKRYIVFHEQLWFKTIVSDIAESIKAIDRQLGVERVVATFCDPTIDIHTGTEVRTIRGIFEACGVPMDCSINSREMYASHVHTALAEEVEEGVPKLQILSNKSGKGTGAPYLIKAIPLQRYNPKKPMAMADHPHDHPVVALSYFLISHAAEEQRQVHQVVMRPWMRPKQAEKWVLGRENVKSR